MGKIRFGFIGCGGNATGHVMRTLQLRDAEIVALCDIRDEALAHMKERNPGVASLPCFYDYREMLNKIPMDAIQISTPHTLHYEMIMASLDKGCHVLTEKPMVCTVQHAKDVIRKVEETQKSLMVSYQRHLQSEFRYLRNQIMAGEFGKIRFINALQDQDWYLGTMGAWRQDPALSGGGQLNDSGSHLLDIVLWMTGLEVDELQAYIQNYESKVDIDSAMSVRFRGGALGNISIVGSSPASGMWEDITIWGDKAVAYMRNGKITIKGLYSKDAYEPTGLPGGTSPDRHFVDSLMGRDTIQVPATCGLRVIELTEAAWESGKTGKPVKVKR